PMIAITMSNKENLVVRSLYKINPPIKATTGCKAIIIVELATVVSFKELNQSVKCMAKKKPEENKNNQSFFSILLNSVRFIHTIGIIKIVAKSMRYILSTDAGACDHLTNIAENETNIMAKINGRTIDFGA